MGRVPEFDSGFGVTKMKVLLVEDDPRVSGLVERGLGQLGFQVEVARDGRRGLNRALRGQHEVVVLDMLLPEMEGLTR